MNSEKGEATFIVLVTTALILLFILFLAMVVFINNVNLIVHNLKNDLFLIGRNTLFSIDRNMLGEDIESFYELDFERLILEGMQESWKLDDTLKGMGGIIEEAQIIEVELLKRGELDNIKNRIVEVPTVHIAVTVKLKPIIFSNLFENKFNFKLHEDIRIEKYNQEV